ncbi:rRNA maturation RNase YbeY [Dongia sedimenti]|uniref:Endoribonuclease YbeY n=1 Tax=Dongia sedimenti TaxID=3064282 RepID=A0ABU0YRE0_9PROT|nr:rRNA maturation RNase YbeY [Rhodospirillaceae bacterium R-7]
MPRAASPRVAVSVIVEHDAWREAIAEPAPLLRRAAGAALAQARRVRRWRATVAPSVAVALIDDRAIRKLNRTYRGKDKPTNVLSFPAGEAPDGKGKTRSLGDVAIALGTVKREARAQGKTVDDHVAHLMVHAVLHLLGYDHEADPDAEEMEALERKALAALGIADPYGAK